MCMSIESDDFVRCDTRNSHDATGPPLVGRAARHQCAMVTGKSQLEVFLHHAEPAEVMHERCVPESPPLPSLQQLIISRSERHQGGSEPLHASSSKVCTAQDCSVEMRAAGFGHFSSSFVQAIVAQHAQHCLR